MKKAILIIGRFQGFHRGHTKIIKTAHREHPNDIIIVAVVVGKKSSLNLDKNPFNFEERKEYIKKILSPMGINPIVVQVSASYIPDVVELLKNEKDVEVTHLYCGTDRINGYLQQKVEDLGVKVVEVKRNDIEEADDDNKASATKVREAIKNNDFESFKKLLPDEMDEDTKQDMFMIARNSFKSKGIGIEESVILSGITHIEDLDVDEFINVLKEFYEDNICAVQKLDGTANISIVKDSEGIHCARFAKKQYAYFTDKDFPSMPMYNALRNATKFILTDEVSNILNDYLNDGDVIDCEVLYGSQPNSIRYDLVDNTIALLRYIEGKKDEEAETSLKELYNKLKNVKINLDNDVYYYNWETEKIEYGVEKENWVFAIPQTLTKEQKQQYSSAEEDIKFLEEWLESKNKYIPKLNNLQAISILLTTVPKEYKDEYKKARIETQKEADELKLNIKLKMVEKLLKNIDFNIGGRNQEGLVIRNKSDGSMTKLVDKEGFTKANQTNWYYMELAGDGIKINGEFKDGVVRQFFKALADKFDIKMLVNRNHLFKKFKDGNGSRRSNIEDYLDDIDYTIDNEKFNSNIVLVKDMAKRCMEAIKDLYNKSKEDNKLNDFVKKRTASSLGTTYNSFKNLIDLLDNMDYNKDVDEKMIEFFNNLYITFYNK